MNAAGQTSRSICVEARFDRLPELLELFRLSSIDPQVGLRASLAIEELFANTIRHGYGGESGSPVWLSVNSRGETLHVIYADAAPAFDPFANLARLREESGRDVESRTVGGLGRLLTRDMAKHCRYHREIDRNVITLEYDLSAAQ